MNVGGLPESDSTSVDTDTPTGGSEDTQPFGDTEEDTDNVDGDCVAGGVWYASNCWYLGEGGENCVEVCATRGGYSDATSTITGTPSEGGGWEACRDIFRLMGYDDEVGAASRLSLSSEGLGCHVWEDEFWWLLHPDVNPEASYPVAERVCACLE